MLELCYKVKGKLQCGHCDSPTVVRTNMQTCTKAQLMITCNVLCMLLDQVCLRAEQVPQTSLPLASTETVFSCRWFLSTSASCVKADGPDAYFQQNILWQAELCALHDALS